MKKRLALILAAMMACSVFGTAVFADGEEAKADETADKAAEVTADAATAETEAVPTLLWNFGEDTESFKLRDENHTYEIKEDSAVFTASGSDPYVYIDTGIEDVETIKWVKIRIKNPSPSIAVEMFAATEGDNFSLAGPECTHIDILPNVDEYISYIAYLPNANIYTVREHKGDENVEAITEWNWKGECRFIRLDPMWKATSGEMSDGDTVEIDYVAFFDSKEAALAYAAEDDGEIVPVEFENDDKMPDLTALMEACNRVRFADVAFDADYYNAVVFAYVNGLFKGTFDTRFEPETAMTRAMFVTVLSRLAGADLTKYEKSAFSDVEDGTWYTAPVGWAADNGVVLGYEDETFRPDVKVTVEQAVAIIARYARSVGRDTAFYADLKDYADNKDVSDWAAADMRWVAFTGVYGGQDGNLLPKNDCPRWLVADMLYVYDGLQEDKYVTLNSNIDPDSVDSVLPGYDDEGFANVFDQNPATKWCFDPANNGEKTVTLTWAMKEPAAIAAYIIMTGNDTDKFPQRNFKTWTLSARNSEDDEWTVIDTVENAGLPEKAYFNSDLFVIEEPEAYKYYKLEVTELAGEMGVFQLSELKLFAAVGE